MKTTERASRNGQAKQTMTPELLEAFGYCKPRLNPGRERIEDVVYEIAEQRAAETLGFDKDGTLLLSDRYGTREITLRDALGWWARILALSQRGLLSGDIDEEEVAQIRFFTLIEAQLFEKGVRV